MNIQFQARERKLLIKVGIVFVIATMVPNMVSDYALDYQKSQERIKLGLEEKVRSYEERLSGVEDERNILRRYVTEYRGLIERGVLFEPNRVKVVKEMKEISMNRKLFPASYGFSPNQVLAPSASVYTQDSTVGISILAMNLEMQMLHDLDIFMFMESLLAKEDNILFPVRCKIGRLHKDFSLEKRPNMVGQCDLAWYWVTDPELVMAHESNIEVRG